MNDHWWVQWQNGQNWTNLDPTLPGSPPGQTIQAAAIGAAVAEPPASVAEEERAEQVRAITAARLFTCA